MSEAAGNMQRFIVRGIAVLGLVLLTTSPVPSYAAATEDAGDTTPRIAGCRIGFEGTFKVGYWTPVWVNVSGGSAAAKLTVAVTTLDNDGVDVTTSAAAAPAGPTLLYVRVGRLGSSVRVKLLGDDGQILDRVELPSPRSMERGTHFVALPSTGQLIVQVGPAKLGLGDVLEDQEAADGSIQSGFAQIRDVASLPTDWFGYEAVDVLVLTTGDVDFCRGLPPTAGGLPPSDDGWSSAADW